MRYSFPSVFPSSSRGSDASRPCVYGWRGSVEDLVDRSHLDLAACVHHHHPFGDSGDDAEVVRDQHDARVHPVLDALDHVEHLRLDRDVERGRRLIGDQHVGIVGDHHRDHRPLPHTARVLVRVLVVALRGVRNADELEQRDGTVAQLSPVQAFVVHRDRLRDLAAHRVHGVQRRERVLEDHRDLAPAVRSQLAFGKTEELGATELDAARDLGRLRQQAEDRHRRHALARPRLPHDAERLVGAQIERHVLDRVHHAVFGREAHAQIAHREHDIARRRPRRRVVEQLRRHGKLVRRHAALMPSASPAGRRRHADRHRRSSRTAPRSTA